MPAEDAEIIRTVERLLPSARRVKVLAFLDGGWCNDNYQIDVDGQRLVLRQSRFSNQEGHAEERYFDSSCSPELIVYDHESNNLITRWVEGHVLAEQPIDPTAAAGYLRRLHSEIPQGIRRYEPIELILSNYTSGGIVFTPVLPILEEWKPGRLSGCHNDLNPYNIIVNGDQFTTIDWESAGDNDPIFDIVSICHGMRYSDEEFFTAASAYGYPDLTMKFLLQTRIVYVAKEHSWAIDQLAANNPRPEVRRQIQEMEQILRRLISLYERQAAQQ